MKIIKKQDASIKEDYIEIHYREMNQNISEVIYYLEANDKLIGKKDDETVIVNLTDIYYVEIVDRKTFVYLKDEVVRVSEGLKELSETLGNCRFVRANKSMLVNIMKIDKMKADTNMRIKLVLENEECVIVNRAYRKEFFAALNKWSKEE